MTHSNYTRENLKNFSRGQLHEACDRLSIPHRRSKENCITDILAAQPQAIAQAEIEAPIEQQNNEQPTLVLSTSVAVPLSTTAALSGTEVETNLPTIGDTHFVGGLLLRCAQVNGDYAVVWDVHDDRDVVMGEVRMGWDCNWCHTLSLDTFATPQEAVVDLRQSLEVFALEDEAVVFEKITDSASGSDAGASDRWESNVNGVLVRITLGNDGYKCNLVKCATGNLPRGHFHVDTVFVDYELAIKESLIAVARLQAQQELPALEVFATARPNIFAVYSHKPGFESKRYEIDLTSVSCTCPHYEHRHLLEGFKDKHIEAVKEAILVRPLPLPMEEEMLLDKSFDELTAQDWERLKAFNPALAPAPVLELAA